MFFLKRYTIRSFEMGLHFRDGEFRGLLGAGTHWFFDPLGKVAVEVVSRRAPFLAHEKLDLIVKSGELKGYAAGARPQGRPARPGLGRRPVRAHPAAGPVRLLDGAARGPRRGRRRPPAAVRARGPEGHRPEPRRRASSSRSGAVGRGCVGVLFLDGRYVETLDRARGPSGRARPTSASSRSTSARRRSTCRPGDHDRRQGHAPAQRRGDLPRRRPPQGGLHGGRLQAGPLPRGPARAPRRRRRPRARPLLADKEAVAARGRGTARAPGRGARAWRSSASASAT